MDETVKIINIEEIMAEIKRDIKEKGYKNDEISFSDIVPAYTYGAIAHSNILDQNLRVLLTIYNVPAYRHLESNRKIGSLIIFAKKIIRKILKFYIEPIVSDQNYVNKLAATSISDLYLEIKSMQKSIDFMEEEIERLKKHNENITSS